jgi:hypothetical protein
MGKKDGNRKRKADEYESENEGEDVELQAELAALLAARNEKKQAAIGGGEAQPEKTVTYNKEGLLKSVEELDRQLPFAETLLVDEFAATIVNENDDIEREVQINQHPVSEYLRKVVKTCWYSPCRWRFITRPLAR